MARAGKIKIADDAYGLTHFLLVAGILYLALGIEQVIAHAGHRPPGHFGGIPLDWTSITALYGGVVLYLTGRILFLRFTVGYIRRTQIAATAVTVAAIPASRYLPALAALGLLTAILIALVAYERSTWRPAAAAR